MERASHYCRWQKIFQSREWGLPLFSRELTREQINDFSSIVPAAIAWMENCMSIYRMTFVLPFLLVNKGKHSWHLIVISATVRTISIILILLNKFIFAASCEAAARGGEAKFAFLSEFMHGLQPIFNFYAKDFLESSSHIDVFPFVGWIILV